MQCVYHLLRHSVSVELAGLGSQAASGEQATLRAYLRVLVQDVAIVALLGKALTSSDNKELVRDALVVCALVAAMLLSHTHCPACSRCVLMCATM